MKKLSVAIAIAALSSIAHGQVADSHGRISIVDGHIHVIGTLKQLSGIEAISPAGLLSLDSVEIPSVGLVELKTPFPNTTGAVVVNTPSAVVIGILGADNRIDVEGNIPTAIGYAGGNTIANGDLTVNFGLGDDPPTAFQVLPEPSSAAMAAIGFVGLLGLRQRRCISDRHSV